MARPRRYEGGFWDWVRKPSYRREAVVAAQSWFRRRGETRTLSDRAIQRRVRELWNPHENASAKLDLEQQGERAVPALIAALQERTFEPRPKGEPYRSDEHPLRSIFDLLGELGAREALPAMIPFANHSDDDFRQWAIAAIASTGSEACIGHVVPALWDSNYWLPSSAMRGILRAIRGDRADKAFVSAMYQEVANLIESGNNSPMDHAGAIVLEVNRDEAAQLLLSDAVFHPERDDLDEIIKLLGAAGLTIPSGKLKRVMLDVKDQVAEYPQRCIYGEALLALARQADPEAELLAREAAEWGIKRASEDAAHAVSILHGVDDLWTRCCERTKAAGIDALNARQRFFYACQYFDFEVCNGGIAQYYANSAGVDANAALEGFEAMNLDRVARILRRSMDLFGREGPSRDWEVLEQQLSRLTDADFAAMDELSSQYFAVVVEARIRMSLYAAEYASDMLA